MLNPRQQRRVKFYETPIIGQPFGRPVFDQAACNATQQCAKLSRP
jgi:hypothetical protein